MLNEILKLSVFMLDGIQTQLDKKNDEKYLKILKKLKIEVC